MAGCSPVPAWVWVGWVAHCWALRNQAPACLDGDGVVAGFFVVVWLLDSGREHLCSCFAQDACFFAPFWVSGVGVVLFLLCLCVWRQAMKGIWWMPWHQEPMKDVGACDKPWGVGNRAVIRGCPNGETWLESCPVTCT